LLESEKSSVDFGVDEISNPVDAEKSSDSANAREHCKESESRKYRERDKPFVNLNENDSMNTIDNSKEEEIAKSGDSENNNVTLKSVDLIKVTDDRNSSEDSRTEDLSRLIDPEK
jgi:hypothetical protein